MSLVHEALQKAEREKQRKLGTAPSAPVSFGAPQAVSTPVIHEPAASAPVTHILREAAASYKPAAPVEETTETNNFLLPALIGCVAIVAIIAIVFLVSNANSVLRPSKENLPAAMSVASTPAAQSASATAPQPIAPPAASAAPASVPSPVAPVTDESKYKISGIMKDPDGKPVAVLNGRLAYEGYFVDGATIKKIDTDRVTLDVKGQEIVLRLF